jgi:hypothetical protein
MKQSGFSRVSLASVYWYLTGKQPLDGAQSQMVAQASLLDG